MSKLHIATRSALLGCHTYTVARTYDGCGHERAVCLWCFAAHEVLLLLLCMWCVCCVFYQCVTMLTHVDLLTFCASQPGIVTLCCNAATPMGTHRVSVGGPMLLRRLSDGYTVGFPDGRRICVEIAQCISDGCPRRAPSGSHLTTVCMASEDRRISAHPMPLRW